MLYRGFMGSLACAEDRQCYHKPHTCGLCKVCSSSTLRVQAGYGQLTYVNSTSHAVVCVLAVLFPSHSFSEVGDTKCVFTNLTVSGTGTCFQRLKSLTILRGNIRSTFHDKIDSTLNFYFLQHSGFCPVASASLPAFLSRVSLNTPATWCIRRIEKGNTKPTKLPALNF